MSVKVECSGALSVMLSLDDAVADTAKYGILTLMETFSPSQVVL